MPYLIESIDLATKIKVASAIVETASNHLSGNDTLGVQLMHVACLDVWKLENRHWTISQVLAALHDIEKAAVKCEEGQREVVLHAVISAQQILMLA